MIGWCVCSQFQGKKKKTILLLFTARYLHSVWRHSCPICSLKNIYKRTCCIKAFIFVIKSYFYSIVSKEVCLVTVSCSGRHKKSCLDYPQCHGVLCFTLTVFVVNNHLPQNQSPSSVNKSYWLLIIMDGDDMEGERKKIIYKHGPYFHLRYPYRTPSFVPIKVIS